jgi:hypothetical protein
MSSRTPSLITRLLALTGGAALVLAGGATMAAAEEDTPTAPPSDAATVELLSAEPSAEFQAVPTPGPGEALILVDVWADYDPTATPPNHQIPLEGAVLSLTIDGVLWPYNCTSDADGECWFLPPADNAPTSHHYVIKTVSAPSGYVAPISYSGGPFEAPFDLTVEEERGYQVIPYPDGGFGFMVANPSLPEQCGLSVALVLDLSGSMSGSESAMFSALDGFLDTLVGSDSEVSLYTFDDASPHDGNPLTNHPVPQDVSTQAGADIVKAWYAGLTADYLTDWSTGLAEVAKQTPIPDAVLLLADGTIANSTSKMVDSKQWTNWLKAQGARFIPVGMGNYVSEPGLQALSGPVRGTDYFLASDFADLTAALSDATTKGCFAAPPPPTVTPIPPATAPVPEPSETLAVTGSGDTTWPGQIAFWSSVAGLTLLAAAWRRHKLLSLR